MVESTSKQIKATWTQVQTTNNPKSRSSHGVSVIGFGTDSPKVVVYGGENEPRVPIDSTLHVLTLSESGGNDAPKGNWEVVEVKDEGKVPPSRVAHAQAALNDTLYIFGGRRGLAMAEEAMVDLWKFDWNEKTWEEVTCTGSIPEARSFHRLIAAGGLLYCFGGCGASGRLSDLHSFDPKTSTWTKLPTYEKMAGRGGACFQANGAGTALYVVAGFTGEEARDVYRYDIASSTWTQLEDFPESMSARSVTAGCTVPNLDMVCVFGGELEPSARGHEGAGNFSNDVLCLNTTPNEERVSQVALSDPKAEQPCPRGWLESSLLRTGDGTADIAVFGGLSGNDESFTRKEDMWILRLS